MNVGRESFADVIIIHIITFLSLDEIGFFVSRQYAILIIHTIHLILSLPDNDLLGIFSCLAGLAKQRLFVLELAYKIFRTLYNNLDAQDPTIKV